MCETCGCSEDASPRLTDLQSGRTFDLDHAEQHGHPDEGDHAHHDHAHHHPHEHPHGHDHHHHQHHDHDHHTTIRLQADILAKNSRLAERNRGWLEGRNVLALNLVSAPGSGKTTLLERTLRDLSNELRISVIEGDQETVNDAQRIRATGCPVVQINTGTGCHLDAMMVSHGLNQLDPPMNSLVLIENVGNLVCPALFDLGERAKVVVVSVTEGEDKPMKYPHMFRESGLMILNKIDLLPHVSFDVARCLDYVHQVNPKLRVLQVSATRGEGLADWYDWLRDQHSPASQIARSRQPQSSAKS